MTSQAGLDDLVRFAADLPTTPAAVEAVAERLGASPAEAAARRAAELGEPEAATVILLAGLQRGERPDAGLVCPLIPFAEDIRLAAYLLLNARGERVGPTLALCATERLSWEREAVVLFIAAEDLGPEPAPAALRTRIRHLARKQLGPADGALLGTAALAVKDEYVEAVAFEWVGLARSRAGKATAQGLREVAGVPLRDLLPERPPDEGIFGHTIRREVPKVGRNDPCPCGSGRKFKHCCATPGAEAPPAAPALRKASSPYDRSMTMDQFNDLRPMEVVRLDPREVSTDHLVFLWRKLSLFGFFEEAMCALDEYAVRVGDDPDRDAEGHRADLLADLIKAREKDRARALAAKQPPDALDDSDRLALDLLEPGPESLRNLERLTAQALRDPGGTGLIDIAWTVLDQFPALGLLLARSALDPEREFDSWSMLDGIEEARDELLLPPGDTAWDLFENLTEIRCNRQSERVLSKENAALMEELEALRARASEEAERARALGQKLRETERSARRPRPESRPRSPGEVPASVPAPAPAPDDGSLKTRIEELKTLLKSSNHERTKLRQQLARVSRQIESEEDGEDSPPSPETDDPGEVSEDLPESMSVLLPVWSDRFEPSLRDLPKHVAREAIATAARIAGGGPGSWTGVKRMRSAPEVRTARLGLSFRLLFRPAPEQRRLTALEVVARKDLETVLRRYR